MNRVSAYATVLPTESCWKISHRNSAHVVASRAAECRTETLFVIFNQLSERCAHCYLVNLRRRILKCVTAFPDRRCASSSWKQLTCSNSEASRRIYGDLLTAAESSC